MYAGLAWNPLGRLRDAVSRADRLHPVHRVLHLAGERPDDHPGRTAVAASAARDVDRLGGHFRERCQVRDHDSPL
jgi:hypothetical protein